MEIHPLIVGPVIAGFMVWLAYVTKSLGDLREAIARLEEDLKHLRG